MRVRHGRRALPAWERSRGSAPERPHKTRPPGQDCFPGPDRGSEGGAPSAIYAISAGQSRRLLQCPSMPVAERLDFPRSPRQRLQIRLMPGPGRFRPRSSKVFPLAPESFRRAAPQFSVIVGSRGQGFPDRWFFLANTPICDPVRACR